ncbi:MAG: hypothetical protein GY716_14515 [bacterium]|nr:hypothetical protein [bacterium]
MRYPRNSLHRALLLTAVVALLASTVAHAVWYETYRDANKALENGEWLQAVQLLDQAIQEKPESAPNAQTYGMNFIEYFPYMKLGIAYYNLGQLDAAAQSFDTEERLGALAGSPDSTAELQRYRGLIADTRSQAAEQEQQRREQMIQDRLAEARTLEGDGKLAEAIGVLDRLLNEADDEPRAVAEKNRLLGEIAAQQQRQQTEDAIARLVNDGRGHLTAGRYEDAASSFARALNLDARPEIQTLLEEAQLAIRAQLDEQQMQDAIARALREAKQLASADDYVAALSELQGVLALDPQQNEAKSLQKSWLDVQARREQEASTTTSIQRLLDETQRHFDSSDVAAAVAASNKILGLDNTNAKALANISRGNRMIREALIALAENLAPFITIVPDHRTSLDRSGEPIPEDAEILAADQVWVYAQRTTSSRLSLTGSVDDEAPVKVNAMVVPHTDDDGEFAALDGVPESTIARDANVVVENKAGLTGIKTVFTVTSELEEGVNTIIVEAVDEHGVQQRIRYAALYVVPLYKEPWAAAVALAVVALVVGATVVRRTRNRNRLLKRRFNPYIAGAPVLKDELFYGRERLMERVLQTIHNNSILLYGERRIGKTSFQHSLKRRLHALKDPEWTFFPVYIDLQGTPEEGFFARLAEDVFHELEPKLNGVQPNEALHDGHKYQYREFVRDVRNVLGALEQATDKRPKLALLIDEIDELNTYDPRVNQRLRSLFMKSFAENLVAVVSGVSIKKHWESEGSPWYNFFEEVPVKPFRQEDARRLIEVPIQGVFTMENGVTDRIIDLGDCKPFLIQKICIALVNRLHEEKRRRITLSDVEAVGSPEEV